MSAFFLLAGYFTPRSFERKGSKQFLIDRLIRLGIPIAIYTTILVNINEYILDVCYRYVKYNTKVEYDPGHL
jgi:fucose 4-O-acetylase-like acetyltransferase